MRIRTEEEIKKKMARRKKRAKEKREKDGSKKTELVEASEETDKISFIDRFTPHVVVRATGKIRSFDLSAEGPTTKAAAQVINSTPLRCSLR